MSVDGNELRSLLTGLAASCSVYMTDVRATVSLDGNAAPCWMVEINVILARSEGFTQREWCGYAHGRDLAETIRAAGRTYLTERAGRDHAHDVFPPEGA